MRKPLYLLLAILFFAPIADASFSPPVKDTATAPAFTFNLPTAKTLEAYLGRRLTLRERVTLYLYERRLKKHPPTDDQLKAYANSDAKLGFIFCMIGILFFYTLIPGFILTNKALKAEREHPGILTPQNMSLARTGKTTTIVMAVLYAVGIIVLVIALSSTHLQCGVR